MCFYFVGVVNEYVDFCDEYYEGDMVYDFYVVMVYIGEIIILGYYIEYVRDDWSSDLESWWKCNDWDVMLFKVGLKNFRNFE